MDVAGGQRFQIRGISGKGNGAICVDGAKPGDVLLASRPLAAVLQSGAKGKRCDGCLLGGERLARCTGCKYNYYCSKKCQYDDWTARHKVICKRAILPWVARCSKLPESSELDLLDGVLLINLLAEFYQDLRTAASRDLELDPTSSLSYLLALKPGINFLDPTLLSKAVDGLPWDEGIIRLILPKFRCNNFEILSGTTPFAHGIFSQASFSFNHSCQPNALPFYHFDGEGLRQDVVAISSIAPGEEVSITYLDPATSYQTRQASLQSIYGFKCTCPLCQWQGSLHREDQELSKHSSDREQVTQALLDFDALKNRDEVPSSLLPIFGAEYLPYLTESMAQLHEAGFYRSALVKARALDRIYRLIYPRNYFMIGYHSLEMAKLAWNSVVKGEVSATEEAGHLTLVEKYLEEAVRILEIGESDEAPVWRQEVSVLKEELRHTK